MTIDDFITNLYAVVFKPVILLMFGAAAVVFFFFLVQCMAEADKPEDRNRCIGAAFWKIGGFVVMIAAVALVALLANTVGVRDKVNLPEPVAPKGIENPLED